MRSRRLLVVTAIVVFGAVPFALAAGADPFGAPETADPVWRPRSFFNEVAPFFGADASGNVLLASVHRDASADDQFAVFERCGTGPVTWQRTVLTDLDGGVSPVGLRVAANGTAMAIWSVTGGGKTAHYSAVRPPGGAWGSPQPIVSDAGATYVQFALADNGDAIATWTDGTAPVGTFASVRAAGGDWSAPEPIAPTVNLNDVAISPSGAAVVVYKGPTPGYVFSRYRPAGGPWSAPAEVLRNNYQNTLDTLRVQFDGAGRTVAVADFRELDDTIRVNVGTNGVWGNPDQTIDDDGAPPSTQYGWRRVQALARHPNGVVAAWTRSPTQSNTNMEIVVARLNGTTWDTKVFDPPTGSVFAPQLAVDAAGEILLAADHFHDNVDDIQAAIAPSLTAPWPELALVSPGGQAGQQYRDPFAAGGGPAFALGWGVHGGSNQRTEVIATKTTGAPCGGVPTPTPAATATATPAPLPLPSATPTPTPTPTPATPSAIADFTTLPAAGRCVRARKLTVKFKKPPKGYAVKAVTVKVNAKKVATVKGKQLKKPLYLRKLPKGTFTITVTITLTKGTGLTEKRRYTACR